MKSYTDLEQSKKLAEILPIESADMCWQYQKDRWVGEPYYKDFPQFEYAIDKRDIPCWSLAALLSILPKSARLEKGKVTELYRISLPVELEASDWYINPVDACVTMIDKLHKQNLI